MSPNYTNTKSAELFNHTVTTSTNTTTQVMEIPSDIPFATVNHPICRWILEADINNSG